MGCTFIRVSGSELVQKFIGEGSRMVRELFVMAREHAPSIIFMDEIDSIGSTRIESGSGGDSRFRGQCLSFSTSWTDLRPPRTSRSSWPPTELTFLTLLCSDPAELTGRLSSHLQVKMPDLTF